MIVGRWVLKVAIVVVELAMEEDEIQKSSRRGNSNSNSQVVGHVIKTLKLFWMVVGSNILAFLNRDRH